MKYQIQTCWMLLRSAAETVGRDVYISWFSKNVLLFWFCVLSLGWMGLIWFHCQYQCKWLTGDSHLQN